MVKFMLIPQMDPSLLKQRHDFKQRSLALPVVEKKSAKSSSLTSSKQKPPSKSSSLPSTSTARLYNTPAVNKHKFALLAQIVNHMKARHQDGDTHALTLDEILEECRLDQSISSLHKNWLLNESLVDNPKIQVISDGSVGETKFAFKPKYNIKERKSLLKLLDRHDQQGLGGILWDDIEESLPKAKKCVKALKDKVIFVTRPDKKQIVFYNDRSCDVVIDEEFQKLWRGIAVDSVDDNKIEEYLNSHGIASMPERVIVKPVVQKRKKANRKRKFKTLNDHLGDVLQDYSSEKK